jgi:2-polyprenyl-3-methyl-5-hydroxy-6-metoxy-1,4-benzoquinol methylase
MKMDLPAEKAMHAQRVKAAEASGGTSSGPILDAALRALHQVQAGGNLLEFGAGTGNFLHQLLANEYQGAMTGCDILPRPAGLPAEISWIQADLNDPLVIPDESFDVIVSTEVIEHLENPRAMIREFWRLLRPAGKVVLTTPNQESLRSLTALIFLGHHVAFQDSCYPAHITALLRADLRRIFAEAGFEEVRFSFTNHGSIPKFPHLTFQQVSSGLLHGRWFSDNLICVAVKPDKRTP